MVLKEPAIYDDGDEPFGEIGVSQYVQARAARVEPTRHTTPFCSNRVETARASS